MFSNLRTRLLVILALTLAASFMLWRNYQRTKGPGRPGQLVSLGLDLRGGAHLALELDQSERISSDPAGDIDLALAIMRKRVDEFGVREPLVQKSGSDRIVIELPGMVDLERAKGIIRRNAYLEFRITDESRALDKALPEMDRALRALGVAPTARDSDRTSAVDDLLSNDATSKVPESSRSGAILSALIQSAAAAGAGGIPGEYVVAEADWPQVDSLLKLEPVRRLWPRGVELKWSADPVGPPGRQFRYLYALEDRPIITGSSLVDARAQIDPLARTAEVVFELDRPGGRTFGQETAKHVNDYMAILLDGKVQGRPPVIQNRIERSGRITLSGRPLVEAQDLALTLRAGSLPTPLKVVEEQTVGPTLGSDSIRGGVLAGLVGTASVILIMVGYYGWSGALAIGALVLYTLYTFGGLSLFDASLTLPGLAGFVLSIGIAVDANVLIFERLREELGAGKTVRLAIRAGFKNAMPAIIDSNLTTVLTALFLFRFGTESVKGFAVTLIIGILASMITAVFVTHTLYLLWLARRPNMASLSVGTLRLFKDAHIDFIRIRRLAYGVTAAVLAAGVVFLGMRHGPDYSVEFTGGTMVRIETSASVTEGTLRDGLEAQGIRGAEIQRIGTGSEFLIRARLDTEDGALETGRAEASVVSGALDRVLGGDGYTLVRTGTVGPKVSGELRTQAALAIFFSFFAVLAYLAVRFEWRFGLAAVLATAHDILATIAFIAVMDLEISLVIVAAILTVLGYSLNDTIVIFDRVRENLRSSRREDFAGSLNRSINETLPRTVLTGGTALTTLVALALFGGDVLQPFALVMFFGILLGTFSSIFIASPVLLAIEKRWPGTGVRSIRRPAPLSGDPPSPG